MHLYWRKPVLLRTMIAPLGPKTFLRASLFELFWHGCAPRCPGDDGSGFPCWVLAMSRSVACPAPHQCWNRPAMQVKEESLYWWSSEERDIFSNHHNVPSCPVDERPGHLGWIRTTVSYL